MLEEILKRLERIESLLQNKIKPFLSLEEAADYLQLSKSHLYKMTHTLKIPF